MFENVFSNLHNKNNEIMMVGIWGKDGLELESKKFSKIERMDMELVGAEIADIISKIDSLKINTESFFLRFAMNGSMVMIFSLTVNYFMIIIAKETIIQGKLAFYLDLCKERLASEL